MHAHDNAARRRVRANNLAVKTRDEQLREAHAVRISADFDESFARVFPATVTEDEAAELRAWYDAS